MYRVRTVWTGVAGAPYYTNLYFTEEGGTAEQARGAVNAVWANMLATIRDDLIFTIEREVPVIDEVTGDIVRVDFGSSNIAGIGTSSEDPVPPAIQALVQARTGAYVGGRETRGRVFIPGMVETNSDGGVPVPGLTSTLNTRFNFLVSQSDAQWVVWSKKNGSYAVVNAAVAWDQWAVLRSRRD